MSQQLVNIDSYERPAGQLVDTSRGGMNTAVSNQWWNRSDDQRFLSLSALRESVWNRARKSDSVVVKSSEFKFLFNEAPHEVADLQDLRVVGEGEGHKFEAAPTHWAFGQMCQLAGVPADFARKLPAQITSDVMEYSLKHIRRVDSVKAYVDLERAELRATTGPEYGRIYDHEVVDAVMRLAGDGDGSMGWKVPGVMDWSDSRYNPHVRPSKETTTLFASDRDVFIFLVDDLNPIEVGTLANGEPDLLFRGFYVWNSEVGSKSLGVATMYLRGVCCNRILWGVEDFSEIRIRHSKNAPDRFMFEAAPALQSFAQSRTTQLIEGVQAAKAAKIASDEDEALSWLRGRGFSRARSKAIYDVVELEEGQPLRSVWDAAQGITAVARTISHQDSRLQVEGEAKKILDKVA